MRVRSRALPALLAVLLPLALRADDPRFPQPHDTEKRPTRPLPPEEAARGFRMPAGFTVDVFAAEPNVCNPIALTWDGRGRLWVAENYTYAEQPTKFDLSLRDRVLLFTDRDGDGRPEERQVFLDNLQRLTSVEVGLGGVWLMCPPRLLFVPDRDGDGKPDGPPETILDGFQLPPENYHNFANGLRWGPDGWLYGRCGGSAPGRVRRPQDPPELIVPLHGGAWRYHPQRQVFEVLCHGTTNPWGHDWTESGECFLGNSVTGHLWHLIPGAHYRRSSTIDPNPLVYEPMEMHADHWHFDTGKGWTASRTVSSDTDQLGGGHAHCGCMIYLGDQWPDVYRGQLLMFNLHGRRANAARLERVGCGYIGRREPDLLFAADPFFRGIDFRYGPDGSVFFLDWNDTGECHEHDGVLRSSGRIFRVRYGTPAPMAAPDLTGLSVRQLVDLHDQRNEWFARQARQELANRASAGKPAAAARAGLLAQLQQTDRTVVRLRALWTLHTLGQTDAGLLRPLLRDPQESVRAWAIRLLTDAWLLDTVVSQPRAETVQVPPDLLAQFVRMAGEDTSGLVRLVLASTLQRLPVALRPQLAAALLSRSEDASDPNQSHLIWYGLIPVAVRNPEALIALAANGRLARVRQWTARRFAEVLATQPALLDGLLARTGGQEEPVRRDVIAGMTAGLAGVRQATAPTGWTSYPRRFSGTDAAQLGSAMQSLDVVFGDGRALEAVRRLALDDQADLKLRQAALRTLIETNAPDLRSVCEKLLRVRFLNTVALQGLTRFEDPAVGRLLAKSYRTFHPSERAPVIEALASRPTFAIELLNQIGAGAIARTELTALQARQIRSFDKPELTAKLTQVWGELRDSPKGKADLIEKLKAELTRTRLAAADLRQGRGLFARTCASCHRLFGSGEEIGPDLTGSGRKDLDYLLSNIVDPSAVLNQDYQMTVLALADGRVVNGVVVAEAERTVTVQTGLARLTIPRNEIEERKRSPQSLMPDGLLQPLTADQIRDLIAYLMTDTQVEGPAEEKTARMPR
jgi:putative membrane-bound dehydrogenase-like protein